MEIFGEEDKTMEIVVEVVGKVENINGRYLHLKITFDGEPLNFQGQQFVPAVLVREEVFIDAFPGQIMRFQESFLPTYPIDLKEEE